MLLLFSNFVSAYMRYILGFVLITIVFIFVIYNTIIMLLFSCRIMILIIRRQYHRMQQKRLNKEVAQITNHIQVDLDEKRDKRETASTPQSDWFKPDDLDKPDRFEAEVEIISQTHKETTKHIVLPQGLELVTTKTFCGGYTGSLIPIRDN